MKSSTGNPPLAPSSHDAVMGDNSREAELMQITTEVLSSVLAILVLKDVRVHEDIRRGKTIISDAVIKLGESFNGLNTQTRAQQQVVASLIDEVSQQESASAHSNRTSVRQIADGMSAIMSGFINMLDEVSTQSSGVITKMEAMTEVMNETFSLLANVEMITKQTNLLSLNAFIEAARSGEAGRGFQVVASEMRNLSQSSAKLNEQIRIQVEQSKKIVHETRDVVNQMAMRDINALHDAKGDADELFVKLADMNTHLSENLGRVSEITNGIDRSVGLAVQSLQFEDIVGQLLMHADREINEKEEVLSDLRGRLQTFIDAVGGGQDTQNALLSLSSGLQVLCEAARSQKSTTVLQQSMDEGDVELF